MHITPRPGVLYSYCKEQGISRDELARRLKVSTATAYRIDSGKTAPSPSFIASLMRLTGQPFEALFEITEAGAA